MAKRILLVEDDDLFTKRILESLRAAGYDCEHTGSFTAAENQMNDAAAHPFDIIVCDHNLPMHPDSKDARPFGLELLSNMRFGLINGHDDVPFILHTGNDEPLFESHVKERGAVYVYKSMAQTDAKLLQEIERLLKETAPK